MLNVRKCDNSFSAPRRLVDGDANARSSAMPLSAKAPRTITAVTLKIKLRWVPCNEEGQSLLSEVKAMAMLCCASDVRSVDD